MTVDYKVLQAMTADPSVETDGYCPECGRPWIDLSPEPPRLSLFVGLVAVQLSEGFWLNPDTLDRAAHAVLALIATMTGVV